MSAAAHGDGRRLPLAIWLLSLCNAYLYVCSSLLITVSALIGFALAPDERLATLPLALQFLAMMLTSAPASLLMGRIGRKAGFLVGGAIGTLGAVVALVSIVGDAFAGYCAATVCFGVFAAFAQYYRFTAAELVPDALRSRGIAAVMAGGVLAAFVGPNLASWSGSLVDGHAFAGPFAVLIGVYLLSMATIAVTDLSPPRSAAVDDSTGDTGDAPSGRRPGDAAADAPGHDRGRPLGTIARQPLFLVAVICQMLGYGTMNLVMTSTPLAMQAHGVAGIGDGTGLAATAFVIQWHVVAMFAPSFVTGHLIARLGIVPVLGAGVALGFACVAINLAGETLAHFTAALVLLGVSWNFLFVGGTTLLTDVHRPEERSRTQALNDFLVFSTVSLTALSAGGIHHVLGWRAVNLGVTPLLAVTGLAVLWLALGRRPRVVRGGAV